LFSCGNGQWTNVWLLFVPSGVCPAVSGFKSRKPRTLVQILTVCQLINPTRTRGIGAAYWNSRVVLFCHVRSFGQINLNKNIRLRTCCCILKTMWASICWTRGANVGLLLPTTWLDICNHIVKLFIGCPEGILVNKSWTDL
jgi:hypothetical protein